MWWIDRLSELPIQNFHVIKDLKRQAGLPIDKSDMLYDCPLISTNQSSLSPSLNQTLSCIELNWSVDWGLVQYKMTISHIQSKQKVSWQLLTAFLWTLYKNPKFRNVYFLLKFSKNMVQFLQGFRASTYFFWALYFSFPRKQLLWLL